MATAEQIKSLVKAYADCNDEKFKTVVLQIAAHEAKLGHDTLARDLKEQMDRVGSKRANIVQLTSTNPMLAFSMPSHDLSELIVSEDVSDKIKRILNEYRNRNKLISYGLTNRRKILIEGNPGTGKTLTASIIASELSLPLYTVQMDKLVTKFMGETSAKLRQIFDSMGATIGVYLFDEFDAIGGQRGKDNDVGEMRRVLNSFLQFIERDHSDSLIIAATNNLELLDQALFRRFDDVIHYQLPSDLEKVQLLKNRLNGNLSQKEIDTILPELASLSHAEINQACLDAIKESVINEVKISSSLVVKTIQERKSAYNLK